MTKYLLIARPIRMYQRCDFPQTISDIPKNDKRNNRTTMPGFKFSWLKQTIEKPEVEVKIFFMRTNNDKRICPGLKARLACIASFAKDKEWIRRNCCACMIATNHWKHHNDRFKCYSLFQIFFKLKPKEKKKKPETGKKEKEKADNQHWDWRWQINEGLVRWVMCLCCAALALCQCYLSCTLFVWAKDYCVVKALQQKMFFLLN